MDKRLLQRFQRLLTERRDELQSRLRAGGHHHTEAKDEGDRAAASTEAEMSVAQRSQAEGLLRVVTAALQRINEGKFGECLNCGQDIGTRRLEAIPWARYCITCQELIDGH